MNLGKKNVSSSQAQHLRKRHISPSSGAGKSSRHTEHAAPNAASTASKASAPGSATNVLSCLWNQPINEFNESTNELPVGGWIISIPSHEILRKLKMGKLAKYFKVWLFGDVTLRALQPGLFSQARSFRKVNFQKVFQPTLRRRRGSWCNCQIKRKVDPT